MKSQFFTQKNSCEFNLFRKAHCSNHARVETLINSQFFLPPEVMHFVRIGYFSSISLYHVNGFRLPKTSKKMRNLTVRAFHVNAYLHQPNASLSSKNSSTESNPAFKKRHCKRPQGYYWNKIKSERIYFKIWRQLIRWILTD